NVTNTTHYMELINGFYHQFQTNNSNVALPIEIRTKLSYSEEQTVKLYNYSIFQNGTGYIDDFRKDSGLWCMYMALTSLGFVLFSYLTVSTFAQAAKNQVYQLKLLFFRSIMHQDISWFDTKSSGDFASKITGYDF